MLADSNAREYADSYTLSQSSVEGPDLRMTDSMRRLATPWNVAISRTNLIDPNSLPEGIILDPACGSGTQLAALCVALNRPGLGVELSGEAAPIAAVNIEEVGKWDKANWQIASRIIWGDSISASKIMYSYSESIGKENPLISLLHIDPARPPDAQKHTIDEMEPPLDKLLAAWAPYLQTGNFSAPALILDLSPRLSEDQQKEVETIVDTIWPEAEKTWQWATQGRGRIDRLSLWVGAVASPHQNRLIRLSKTGTPKLLEGSKETPISDIKSAEIGEHLTIVDPCLIASGLAESWKNIATSSESRWYTITGRRPILITSEPILSSYHELHIQLETYDMIHSFVQISGEVVAHVPQLEHHLISNIAQVAVKVGLSSLKLRCTIDPEIQPQMQSEMDREMRNLTVKNSGNAGFITEVIGGYVICRSTS
jgi:hypothetical protein